MRILVIRHSSLGDIIHSFPAFASIRAYHAQDEITLLTSPTYASFLRASPWFDKIEVDSRPDFWNLPGLLRLRRQLTGFDKVYDLQTSGRSSHYFRLAGKPAWSGIASGCAYPDAENRTTLHTRERQAQQLRIAGVEPAGHEPDLSWLMADVSGFNLPQHYTVLVPGASAHRLVKRFPAEKFHELVQFLPAPPVIIGTSGEKNLAEMIGGIDLTGKTNLFQLASVLKGAVLAVGNDTGPMHFAAAMGTPCISLFSRESDPALASPRYPDGGWATVLQEPDLKDLTVAQIRAHLP